MNRIVGCVFESIVPSAKIKAPNVGSRSQIANCEFREPSRPGNQIQHTKPITQNLLQTKYNSFARSLTRSLNPIDRSIDRPSECGSATYQSHSLEAHVLVLHILTRIDDCLGRKRCDRCSSSLSVCQSDCSQPALARQIAHGPRTHR